MGTDWHRVGLWGQVYTFNKNAQPPLAETQSSTSKSPEAIAVFTEMKGIKGMRSLRAQGTGIPIN